MSVFADVITGKTKDSLQAEALWGIFYSVNIPGFGGDDVKQRLDALVLAGQSDNSELKVESNRLLECLVGIVEPKFCWQVTEDGASFTGR